MIGDFNINMGGSSKGNRIIYVNAQDPTTEPTRAPTFTPTRAPTQAPSKEAARERISRFVEEGQMFFVREDQIALGRNLSSPMFPSMTNQVNNIEWFCKPAFSPDNNNDGNYNNVVSSFITFVNQKKNETSTFDKIGGYTAAWSGTNFGSYEEYGTDYEVTTTKYNYVGNGRSSTTQRELYGKDSTMGLVASGEGRWTFDTNELIFDLFKESLGGRELTGETCKTIYDEIYVEETKLIPTPAPTRDPINAPTTKSPKKKKSNKNKKNERKLQTSLKDDNYDVNENEYASLKEQIDKLEKTVSVLLGRLDELL
jgi:polyhydroxyalkanoate synthesis regulator phasin